MSSSSCIVVTDLDGTLLDHHSYSFSPAAGAMERLRELNIPLVLNTSKTRAELAMLRRQLDNQDAFIVENGSALFFPAPGNLPPGTGEVDGYYCHVIGTRYCDILATLDGLRSKFRFTGFSELSVAQLVELTGLQTQQAALALAREFSEPLVWQDKESLKPAFAAALAESGLYTLQGGRFLHVIGNTDKGRCLDSLRDYYGETSREMTIVALGDGPNDIEMLKAADIGVIIRSPNHGVPVFDSDNRIMVSEREGPRGWSDEIHTILDELQVNNCLQRG